MRAPHFWPFARRQWTSPGRNLSVLIADDDVLLRSELENFLWRRGCRTQHASDGSAALRCLARAGKASPDLGRIDVVIADADLPGRSGIDILMAAQGNRWGVEVVLMSAYANDELRSELVRLGAVAVLSKPVSLARLARALSQVIEERGTC